MPQLYKSSKTAVLEPLVFWCMLFEVTKTLDTSASVWVYEYSWT